MVHPVGVAYLFASIVLVVVLYSAGRLFFARYLGRHNHDDVGIAHILMGTAMIGMLVPRWNLISSRIGEPLFGLMAIYFAVVAAGVVSGRTPWGGDDPAHPTYHPLVHLLMSCAMLDMYWLGMPITGSPGSTMVMSGVSTRAGGPGLTLLIIVLLVIAAVWLVDSITSFAPKGRLALTPAVVGGEPDAAAPAASVDRPWLAPRLEISCHVAMCITMAYMLVLMV